MSGRGEVHAFSIFRDGGDLANSARDGQMIVEVVLDEQDDLVVTSVFRAANRPRLGARVELEWIEVDGHPFPGFCPESDT